MESCATLNELGPRITLTPLQAFLLRRIEAGDSPYTGGEPRTKEETARELEKLARMWCWEWKDPLFPVMRVLTPLGAWLLGGRT